MAHCSLDTLFSRLLSCAICCFSQDSLGRAYPCWSLTKQQVAAAGAALMPWWWTGIGTRTCVALLYSLSSPVRFRPFGTCSLCQTLVLFLVMLYSSASCSYRRRCAFAVALLDLGAASARQLLLPHATSSTPPGTWQIRRHAGSALDPSRSAASPAGPVRFHRMSPPAGASVSWEGASFIFLTDM